MSERSRLFMAVPMLIIVTGLVIASEVAAHTIIKDTSVSVIAHAQWIALFPSLFILSLVALVILESIVIARQHINPATQQLNLESLRGVVTGQFRPIFGTVIVGLMGVAIIGSSDLNEIYRTTAQNWFDAWLWALEKPLFNMITASALQQHFIWDALYFLVWPYLFVCMALLYRWGTPRNFAVMGIAIVLVFYITRIINLWMPTAGPVFFIPAFFQLDGSASAGVQSMLRLYMSGKISQNGLMPATMGMPSVHVELMVVVAYFLRSIWKKSMAITVPLMLAIWASTVVLGWHYALDGAIGIIVATLAIITAKQLQRRLEPVAA